MTDYDGLKATELKELLKERNIPSTGLTRKQQYIDALEAQDAQEPNDSAKVEEESTLDDNKAEAPITEDAGNNDATANGDSNGNHDNSQSADQSDVLKRKRSATPTEDEESVQKKLKSTDDNASLKLAEDLEKDAPVPIESTADETIKPMPVSDDVMDITGQEEVRDADIENAAEVTESHQASADPMAIDPITDTADTTGPPSTHPPTSALYIRNLLRPLQIPPFREHLLDLATPASQDPDASLIDEIHLDTFKSHAFVLFTSTAAAVRARAGLHDRIWPEETQRKALWVDFVPTEQARAWITTELEAGKSKRFEVVYSTSSTTGEATASLEEASQQNNNHNNNNNNNNSATPGATPALPGPGMPNAPTGPRGDRPQVSGPAPQTQQFQSQPQSQSQSHAPRKPLHSTASLEHFPSTTARPKIFYQPVSATLVEKRLEELDRETSRDWDGGRQKPFGSALDQLRRYTFEDGDVVVDGGVDFGGFGRDKGAGGGAGHGGHGGGGRRRGGGGGRRR
jgi:uncharacterized membrane protein YgcG